MGCAARARSAFNLASLSANKRDIKTSLSVPPGVGAVVVLFAVFDVDTGKEVVEGWGAGVCVGKGGCCDVDGGGDVSPPLLS